MTPCQQNFRTDATDVTGAAGDQNIQGCVLRSRIERRARCSKLTGANAIVRSARHAATSQRSHRTSDNDWPRPLKKAWEKKAISRFARRETSSASAFPPRAASACLARLLRDSKGSAAFDTATRFPKYSST